MSYPEGTPSPSTTALGTAGAELCASPADVSVHRAVPQPLSQTRLQGRPHHHHRGLQAPGTEGEGTPWVMGRLWGSGVIEEQGREVGMVSEREAE